MFANRLNFYLMQNSCNGKKLSELTGISEATISRYRSGKTVPSLESGIIESIADAFSSLSSESEDKEKIFEDLLVSAYEDLELVDYEVFSAKISLLINSLGITQNSLAEKIHLSSSYLSKICSAQVKPRNPIFIAESIARYISTDYIDDAHKKDICQLLWNNESGNVTLSTADEYYRSVRKWLLTGENARNILVNSLLHQYGEYDISTYLPYHASRSLAQNAFETKESQAVQTFLGLEGIKKACYCWYELSCVSSVNDEIFIYDEICTEVARRSPNTTKAYLEAIEKILQSGKKIIIVNNLQNDLSLVTKKMAIWLPLTMSMRVENHYLNEPAGNICKNMLLISSNAVLIGNMFGDDYDTVSCLLIRSATNILNAKKKSEVLLQRSRVSNHVFLEESDFASEFLPIADSLTKEERILFYFPVPPIATMSEELFKKILRRSSVPPETEHRFLEQYRKEKESADYFIQNHVLDVHIELIETRKQSLVPVAVALNDFETNLKITYTYEEYQQHLTEVREYAALHSNIHLSITPTNSFKNMNIIIIPDKFAGSTPTNDIPVYTTTTEKPIIDSITNLLYIISPQNRQKVLENDETMDILNFYKGLTEE